MRTVTAMDLRKRLGQILDAAAAGEAIAIERGGKPMAVLVTPEAARRLDGSEEQRIARSLAALDRLDEFRGRMAREHPPQPGDRAAVDALRRERAGRTDRIVRAAARTSGELEADLLRDAEGRRP
ncbi:MAG TPA: type II toxin-antitoxin system prevent-host-death family antitoxin [Candidatus Dormibacteraeota bacterium]|nr:type II toxin-antitoxin system prevent-host-death family antitoxin [Candidatus Dormibacteraeota bacterium]